LPFSPQPPRRLLIVVCCSHLNRPQGGKDTHPRGGRARGQEAPPWPLGPPPRPPRDCPAAVVFVVDTGGGQRLYTVYYSIDGPRSWLEVNQATAESPSLRFHGKKYVQIERVTRQPRPGKLESNETLQFPLPPTPDAKIDKPGGDGAIPSILRAPGYGRLILRARPPIPIPSGHSSPANKAILPAPPPRACCRANLPSAVPPCAPDLQFHLPFISPYLSPPVDPCHCLVPKSKRPSDLRPRTPPRNREQCPTRPSAGAPRAAACPRTAGSSSPGRPSQCRSPSCCCACRRARRSAWGARS